MGQLTRGRHGPRGRSIRAAVSEVGVGAAGDEGFGSILGPDGLFIVDADGVQSLTLEHLSLAPLPEYLESLAELNDLRSLVPNTDELHPNAKSREHDDDDYGFGTLSHVPGFGLELQRRL